MPELWPAPPPLQVLIIGVYSSTGTQSVLTPQLFLANSPLHGSCISNAHQDEEKNCINSTRVSYGIPSLRHSENAHTKKSLFRKSCMGSSSFTMDSLLRGLLSLCWFCCQYCTILAAERRSDFLLILALMCCVPKWLLNCALVGQNSACVMQIMQPNRRDPLILAK